MENLRLIYYNKYFRLTVLPQIRQKFDSGELLVGSILNDPKITPFFKVYSEFLSRKDTTCDPKISKIQKVSG